jgi:DNA-binding NarL/FixJ family response regulator
MMKKTSVLLVDRHPALVESIRDLLKTMFDTVIMVSDENSLIEALDRLDPDLVVADLSVSVTQEPNVVTLLNKYDSKLKFIVLSTYEEREMMENCISSGASGYVLKRLAARNLMPAVEQVQKGGTYVSPCMDDFE